MLKRWLQRNVWLCWGRRRNKLLWGCRLKVNVWRAILVWKNKNEIYSNTFCIHSPSEKCSCFIQHTFYTPLPPTPLWSSSASIIMVWVNASGSRRHFDLVQSNHFITESNSEQVSIVHYIHCAWQEVTSVEVIEDLRKLHAKPGLDFPIDTPPPSPPSSSPVL